MGIPKSINELIALIGEPDTLALVKLHGGSTLFFAKNKAGYLGISSEASTKLYSLYVGCYLFIPRCHHALLDARNSQIKCDKNNGTPVKTLARKFNLTDRQIINICGLEPNRNSPQLDLFS